MPEAVTIPFLLTLNPTAQQEQSFKGALGAVRFAYNVTLAHALENWEANKELPKEERSYNSIHPYDLAKWLANVKDSIAPWNRQHSKYVFESAAQNVGKAFQNFIKSNNGLYDGKYNKPKFKSIKDSNSYGCMFGNLKIENNYIYIPKIGWTKFYESNKTILWLLSQGG